MRTLSLMDKLMMIRLRLSLNFTICILVLLKQYVPWRPKLALRGVCMPQSFLILRVIKILYDANLTSISLKLR